VNADTLSHAITRTIRLHQRATIWRKIQRNGMNADFSWAQSGKAYADLYARLLADG